MTKGLSFDLVQKAVNGDAEAIERVICIYEPYINKISSKKLYDKYGKEYLGIDVDLKDTLVAKLIEVITKFKL